MAAIYGPSGVKVTGKVGPHDRHGLIEAASQLVELGASILLLGCTELPIAIPADASEWPAPTIDPAVEVARKTILKAGGAVVPLPVFA